MEEQTMDIQKIITEVLEQLSKNEELRKLFDVDPVKVLEKLLKVDLPDDQINAVIKAIKAKLDMNDIKDAVGNLDMGDVADAAGKLLGGLFGKK